MATILQLLNPDIYLPIIQQITYYVDPKKKKEHFMNDSDSLFSDIYSISNYFKFVLLLILLGVTVYKLKSGENDMDCYIDIGVTAVKFFILLFIAIIEIIAISQGE